MARRPAGRCLDAEEERSWLEFAAVLLTLPGALDGELQRDAGMTFYEYLVLAALGGARGRSLRLSDLAVVTNGSLARLSQVVTKLEHRGWVRRRPDADDGRYTLAVLEPEGWRRLSQAGPGHVAALRRLVFDPLTREQVGQLRGIHRRIRKALATEATGGRGPH